MFKLHLSIFPLQRNDQVFEIGRLRAFDVHLLDELTKAKSVGLQCCMVSYPERTSSLLDVAIPDLRRLLHSRRAPSFSIEMHLLADVALRRVAIPDLVILNRSGSNLGEIWRVIRTLDSCHITKIGEDGRIFLTRNGELFLRAVFHRNRRFLYQG